MGTTLSLPATADETPTVPQRKRRRCESDEDDILLRNHESDKPAASALTPPTEIVLVSVLPLEANRAGGMVVKIPSRDLTIGQLEALRTKSGCCLFHGRDAAPESRLGLEDDARGIYDAIFRTAFGVSSDDSERTKSWHVVRLDDRAVIGSDERARDAFFFFCYGA